VSGGGGGRPLDEWSLQLRSLQARALEPSQGMGRMQAQMRERAPAYPRMISQANAMAAQMQALSEEIHSSLRSSSARAALFNSVFHPLSSSFNPSASLRVKPVRELDALEQQCFEAFAADAALAELSAAELRDELADFNEAALKLARWPLQAAQLPLPTNPQGAEPAAGAALTAVGASAGAAPTPAPAAAAESLRRLGDARAEEAELQRALAAMTVGQHMRRPQHAH